MLGTSASTISSGHEHTQEDTLGRWLYLCGYLCMATFNVLRLLSQRPQVHWVTKSYCASSTASSESEPHLLVVTGLPVILLAVMLSGKVSCLRSSRRNACVRARTPPSARPVIDAIILHQRTSSAARA
ncbi:hypothetical protein C2E23DRAFT_568339 [Lenzites betulinus]|nr:hypothetical protein C2E23DRAFT_568339 [Lenzites betulinus]